MKRISKAVAIFVALMMLLTLAACGQKTEDKTAGTTKAETTQTTAETQEEVAKPVKILLWEAPTPTSPPYSQGMYDLRLKRFKEKYPNVEIETKSLATGTDYRQEYDKALMAGNAPAAFGGLAYVDVPSRIANGTIADITELYNNWEYKDKAFKAFDEAISKDGKWYAIPMSYYFAGITYNAKTLTDGGADVNALPNTWDEFAAMGQKVTDKTKNRFGYAVLGMDWNAWEFTPWVWSAGGEMVTKNADGSWKLAFNEEPGVDAAMIWHDFIWKYQMTQKNVLEDWNGFIDDIQSGRCAYGWLTPDAIANDAKTKYGIDPADFGVIKVPGKTADKAVTFSGGETWAFNPKIDKDQLKAAWDYANFISYDEAYVMEEGKYLADNNAFSLGKCVRTDLVEKYTALSTWPERWKKDMAALAQGIVKPEPYSPHWNDIKNAIAKPLQKIIMKKDITRDECKAILDGVADELYNKFPDTFKK